MSYKKVLLHKGVDVRDAVSVTMGGSVNEMKFPTTH